MRDGLEGDGGGGGELWCFVRSCHSFQLSSLALYTHRHSRSQHATEYEPLSPHPPPNPPPAASFSNPSHPCPAMHPQDIPFLCLSVCSSGFVYLSDCVSACLPACLSLSLSQIHRKQPGAVLRTEMLKQPRGTDLCFCSVFRRQLSRQIAFCGC